jgi:hypothetical protein
MVRAELRAAAASIEPERTLADLQARIAHRPCHCLCSTGHPDQLGVCQALSAVTIRNFRLWGVLVPVPLCAPCAEALDSQVAS